MKIAIYSEATRGLTSLCGSEFIVAVLAEHLSAAHDVEVLHHSPALTAAEMGARFGVPEAALKLRCMPVEPFPSSSNPWKRHREERDWHASISAGYDLTIYIAHELPPFCRSPRGILLVLFPFFDLSRRGASAAGRAGIKSPIWTRLRDFYLERNRRGRLRSYALKTSISEFSRDWLLRRGGVDSEVIYPPCDLYSGPLPQKENIVLSVGRFAGKNVSKKQREMLAAFKELHAQTALDWRYACTGGLGPAEADQQYFAELERSAKGAPVDLLVNLSRADLRGVYGRAKIFWHATGLDEDESSRPEFAEHFGIVTVEAMSAGCVPVVIRKGAQPEIVEHGVSGFLWDTLEEAKEFTRLLAHDDELRQRMAKAAVERSYRFSRAAFIKHWDRFAAPVMR